MIEACRNILKSCGDMWEFLLAKRHKLSCKFQNLIQKMFVLSCTTIDNTKLYLSISPNVEKSPLKDYT